MFVHFVTPIALIWPIYERKYVLQGSQLESENQTCGATDVDEEYDNDDIKFEKYRVTNYLTASPIAPDHPLVILQVKSSCLFLLLPS